MRIINKEEFELEQEQFFEQILKGDVYIHPTDTIYGLGANATNKKAVQKIRELKKREDMPFSVIAPSKEWIKENCELNEKVEQWIEKLPGPYTLILRLKNKDAIADNVAPGLDTVGIRIPDHWFSMVANVINIPLVTTSANIVGGDFMTSLDNLNIDIKSRVDFIVYEGKKKGRPSTLVDLSKEGEEIKTR
ncbi:threonylcarbamoyl-AMP synthase [Candidatus Woesearchaeota archaeon]|jgi:L-threonylcarbamoyladenylate synthase|nr:threonylcarbamoyl-AMP synthase [Candidatus Woesearchaeota archaeon]